VLLQPLPGNGFMGFWTLRLLFVCRLLCWVVLIRSVNNIKMDLKEIGCENRTGLV
jgi:hypothetical protein